MVRAALILALLVGPLPPLGVAEGSSDAPAKCSCCCPAGACQCGCVAPLREDRPDDTPKAPRFCACDATPLNLPSTPVNAPERPEISGAIEATADVVPISPTPDFLGHLPHGPPETLGMLSTIILLN